MQPITIETKYKETNKYWHKCKMKEEPKTYKTKTEAK